MKRVLKSSLSVILAITIIFSSAYVGLSEIDFGGLFAVKAEAANSGSCGDNLTWTFDDEGTLSISGTGNMTSYTSYVIVPWYSSRTSIKSVVVNSGVTSIGENAFAYCTNLGSISIHDSVISIGRDAFYNTEYYNNTKNWKNNVLYIGNHLIKAKGTLGDYVIKNGTKTIADNAFTYSVNISTVIIPDSVTNIGASAFYECTKLTSVTLGNGLKSIGRSAFMLCRNLISINIPDSVTSIGNSAFYGCRSLSSIEIPDNVTSIDSYTFLGCTNLTKIKIPDSVTNIGLQSFCDCSGLTVVYIPNSVKKIGFDAFGGSTTIETIYYVGSRVEWDTIKISNGNECLNDAKIIFNYDVFNSPKWLDSDSYTINVKALDENGKYVPPKGADDKGAEVTVYLGTKDIITKNTDESGNVTFTKDELLKNGVREEGDLLGCTISAHLKLDNGLELCSEYVDDDGRWLGARLLSCTELVVDEPRMHYNLSVGFVGKTESERQERCEKINSVMGEFAEKFAQSTNGHVLISDYSITSYESDTLMGNNALVKPYIHEIYIWENPQIVIGRDIITASTYTEQGVMFFKYNNGYFDSTVMCHEAGHLFLGFYDEYCYGGGYDYQGIQNAGYWMNWGGQVPRPDGAPSNFGLMDDPSAFDGDLELSTKKDYSYLNGIEYDSTKPELYTLHYYEEKESTEETMMDCLDGLAKEKGYSTIYSLSNGSDQTADYWYSKIDSVEYSSSDFICSHINSGYADVYKSSTEKHFNTLNVDFKFANSVLTGSFSSNSETYVFADSVGAQEISDVAINDKEGFSSFSIPITKDGVFNIYVVENKDDTYLKEVYSVNVKKEKDDINGEYFLVSVMYNEELPLGDGTQKSKVLYVLGNENKNIENKLSSMFHITENITPQGLSWNVVNGNSYEPIETTVSNGENNTLIYDCLCTGDGKYFIPITESEYSVSTTISDVAFENDNRYDDMVWVSFNDTMEEEGYYTIYYGKEEKFEPENMECATVDSSSKRIPIYMDVGEKYYVYVTCKTLTGGLYVTETPTTYTNTYADSDSDGIPDYWLDIYYQLNDLEDIAGTDSDKDSLTNLEEYENSTNPLSPDTDGDNLYDAIEIVNNLNPLAPKTDGTTDDYTAFYGTPDLKITDVSFDDEYVYFNVSNETAGKAMRTIVNITNAGENIASWTVNVDSQSTVEFSVERSLLNASSGFKIEVDSTHITRDVDYSNNSFEYIPATSISLEDVTIVKGSVCSLAFTSEPSVNNEIYNWSFMTNNKQITFDVEKVLLNADGVGHVDITVETLSGLTTNCTVSVVPFEGAEYTEFDCQLINDGTDVAIIGYIGDDTDISIPETIGGLPVTQLNSYSIPLDVVDVLIPSTVTNISTKAFRRTIESINVDENNLYYSSDSGVLFNKDKTILIKYPAGKTDVDYSISDSVCCIGNSAFEECSYLTSVTIPNSVTNVGANAFAVCPCLEKIEIPESVESIDTTAFTDSTNTAIFCQKDSPAHTFAVDNSIPFIANDDNTMVDLSKNVIQTKYLNSEIADIMALSQGLTYSVNSEVSGTGALVDILKDGLVHSQFTLVVNGDTNGDSICDALDCFEVERDANGNTNLSGVYAMAADSNSDDMVDITDYQAIVNKALAS